MYKKINTEGGYIHSFSFKKFGFCIMKFNTKRKMRKVYINDEKEKAVAIYFCFGKYAIGFAKPIKGE